MGLLGASSSGQYKAGGYCEYQVFLENLLKKCSNHEKNFCAINVCLLALIDKFLIFLPFFPFNCIFVFPRAVSKIKVTLTKTSN